MSISTIIPVYNERENLVPLVERLTAALEPLGREYEILFVDDGSTDGTFARLRDLAAADRRVKVRRASGTPGAT